MPPKAQQQQQQQQQGGGAGKAKQAQPARAGKKESSGGGGGNADFLKSEDVLQAVLLADSFQVKLQPLTQQKPKVLLPLLNIPMLEYSLEFLVSGGVGELFVFCCSHAAAIQSYLDSPETGAKWKRRKNLVVRTIVADCATFGDALRYLDTLDVIKSDFVLISGDVISNVKLESVVKEHKARVQADKRNMMTMLFKQASHSHRTRSLNDDAVLAIDPTTNQLLVYDNQRRSRYVSIEKTLLTDSTNPIQLRYDLMDSHISICTPEVLMLFTDNFDWQSFHGDFLTGVLGSEILGNKLFVHLIKRDEYAARCDDLRTWDAVSKDIIHRWTYPLVPDNNLLGGLSTYKYHRGNIYREDNVTVSREAQIGEDTVIGAGTVIGARSRISKSVIGRDCVIGAGVVITGSYIWSGVTIEDGCVIDRAILADGVTVRRGTRIERGAILSFNVVIGPRFTVPAYTKITTARSDEDDEGLMSEQESDGEAAAAAAAASSPRKNASALSLASSASPSSPSSPANGEQWDELEVGLGGVGRIYESKPDDDADSDEEDEEEKDGEAASDAAAGSSKFPYKQSELNSIAPNPLAVAAWLAKVQYGAEESEDEWDEVDDPLDSAGAGSGAGDEEDDPSSANRLGSSSASNPLNLHFHKFAQEVSETLKRGHDEHLKIDDISLEMSGLKFSHNTNVEEFAHATFLALFAILHEQFNPRPAAGQKPQAYVPLDPKQKSVMQALGLLLKSWHPILKKFADKLPDQIYMLAGLEQACLASGFVSGVGVSSPSSASSSSSSGGVGALGAASSSDGSSIYTPLFTSVLILMYDRFEVWSDEAIAAWADQARDAEGEDYILLKQSKEFRDKLEEAEEEEDDEEEED